MALVLQGDTKSLLQLARRLYQGTPPTKDILENCLAFLRRKATVHSTNFKMSDACKYLYAIGSPYSATGRVAQIKPDKQDLETILSPMGIGFTTGILHITAHEPQSDRCPDLGFWVQGLEFRVYAT